MNRFIFSMVLVSFLGAGLHAQDNAPAKSADSAAGKTVVVPFELIGSQHMVVNVKINDKGPYRLIFDTGAPITLLNNKTAKEADVFGKDFKAPLFGLFGTKGIVKIKKIGVGDVHAADVNTIVMDHPTVAAIASIFGPIEGIVGLSFFGNFTTTIDYQKKELTFAPCDHRPVDLFDHLTKLLTKSGKSARTAAPSGLLGFKVAKDKSEGPGVTVSYVYEGSPAAEAGLKKGDRILVLDRRWTDSVIDCYDAAEHIRPGSTIEAQIRRDGKEQTLKIKVGLGL